jgi:hypothetical protein
MLSFILVKNGLVKKKFGVVKIILSVFYLIFWV